MNIPIEYRNYLAWTSLYTSTDLELHHEKSNCCVVSTDDAQVCIYFLEVVVSKYLHSHAGITITSLTYPDMNLSGKNLLRVRYDGANSVWLDSQPHIKDRTWIKRKFRVSTVQEGASNGTPHHLTLSHCASTFSSKFFTISSRFCIHIWDLRLGGALKRFSKSIEKETAELLSEKSSLYNYLDADHTI